MNELALLVTLALLACASQEKFAQERTDKQQARDDYLYQIEIACAEDGAIPGTIKYRDCRQAEAFVEGYRVIVAENRLHAALQPTPVSGVSSHREQVSGGRVAPD